MMQNMIYSLTPFFNHQVNLSILYSWIDSMFHFAFCFRIIMQVHKDTHKELALALNISTKRRRNENESSQCKALCTSALANEFPESANKAYLK